MSIFTNLFKNKGAIINFIDLDNNKQLLLTSGIIKGRKGKPIIYDAQAQIDALNSKGYILADNNFTNDSVFGDEKEKSFTVAFHHGTATVDANHLNYGFEKNDVEKQIKQIVHYEGKGVPMPADNISVVTFKRSLVIDTVTKKAIKSLPWRPTKQNALLISTPTIPGFIPDQTVVGGKKIGPNDADQKFKVKYHVNEQPSSNEQHAVIEFVDLANENKIIKKVELTGQPSAPIKHDVNIEIKQLELEGYRLINNSFVPDKKMEFFGTDDNYIPTFVVTMKKSSIAVDSNHPNAAVDPSEYERSFTWTVKYQGADKQTPEAKIQTLKWERSVTFNQDLNKLEAKGKFTTPWQAKGKYEKVTVPVVNGYHTDEKVVNLDKPQMKDQIQTIVYKANGRIIPIDEDGKDIPNASHPRFMTDPSDPTKVQTDQIVPDVKGYNHEKMTVTPSDPAENIKVQYKKKNQDNVLVINTGHHEHAKSQEMPVAHKSVDINAKQDKQQVAYVNFIDLDHHGKQLTSSGPLVGKVGESINDLYNTEIPIRALRKAGYDIVFDSFDEQGVVQKFQANNLMSQIFTIGVCAHRNKKLQIHLQTAFVNFIDVDNNDIQVTSSGPLKGKAGDSINDLYSTQTPLKKLRDAGYELVFNGFDPKGMIQRFDNNPSVTQIFTVGLRQTTK